MKMNITITAVSKRQRARLYLYIKGGGCQTFLYTKIQALCKNQDNIHYVFIYKKQDTLRYAIFHENFEVGVYKQKA